MGYNICRHFYATKNVAKLGDTIFLCAGRIAEMWCGFEALAQ
jgi:hypothetical protein